MMQNSSGRILIDLDEEIGEAQTWIQEAGKPMVVKTVATEDLISALASGFKITTGVLPHGTKFYSGTRQQYRIGIEVPGGRRMADFSLRAGKLSVEIPFPDMLFVFEISRGIYSSSRAFSIIPPFGLPTHKLYMFPFGNVSAEGAICWGSAARGEVEDAIVLDSAVGKFFTSGFSGHYVFGTSTFAPPPGVGDLWEFLEFLKDKDDFPSECLRPCGMMLSDVML
jgi:hypothetical protein